MKKAVAISTIAFVQTEAVRQVSQNQRSFVQTQMPAGSFAQVRAPEETQNSDSFDPQHTQESQDAPSAGEDQTQLPIKSFQDVDGPVNEQEAESIDRANEENAGDDIIRAAEDVPEEHKSKKEKKIESNMDYSMTPEDVTASDLVEGQQVDDSTPDQDDPEADEDEKAQTAQNEDAGKDADKDNTDSIVADTSEQDRDQQESREDLGEEGVLVQKQEDDTTEATFVPSDVSEGNAPTEVEAEDDSDDGADMEEVQDQVNQDMQALKDDEVDEEGSAEQTEVGAEAVIVEEDDVEETVTDEEQDDLDAAAQRREEEEADQVIADHEATLSGSAQENTTQEFQPIPTSGSMINGPSTDSKEEEVETTVVEESTEEEVIQDDVDDSAQVVNNEVIESSEVVEDTEVEQETVIEQNEVTNNEENEKEPNPWAYVRESQKIATTIRTYLNFVQKFDEQHEFSDFEDCVQCYYQFQLLNFRMEAHQRLFLDIARYTGEYLKEEGADKKTAEESANEHFYELAETARALFEEYSEFIGDYDQDAVISKVSENFDEARFAIQDSFQNTTGIEQHELIVEEEAELGVDTDIVGSPEALKQMADNMGSVVADGELPEQEKRIQEAESSPEQQSEVDSSQEETQEDQSVEQELVDSSAEEGDDQVATDAEIDQAVAEAQDETEDQAE